jgi:hypothetical protein
MTPGGHALQDLALKKLLHERDGEPVQLSMKEIMVFSLCRVDIALTPRGVELRLVEPFTVTPVNITVPKAD